MHWARKGSNPNTIQFNSLLLLNNIYIYIYKALILLKHKPKYYQVPVALHLAVLDEIIVTTVWGVLGLWMGETTFRYGITLPNY